MVFLTNKMENVMSMYDERIVELEALLDAANREAAANTLRFNVLEKTFTEHTNILSGVLHYVAEQSGVEIAFINDAIAYLPEPGWKVRDVLHINEALPSHLLNTEYYVSITVPVTICVSVEAPDEEAAEEIARDKVECDGIESYDMEYNLHYDAEYRTDEA